MHRVKKDEKRIYDVEDHSSSGCCGLAMELRSMLFSSCIMERSWLSISSVFFISFSNSSSDFYNFNIHSILFSSFSSLPIISFSLICFSSFKRLLQNLLIFSFDSISIRRTLLRFYTFDRIYISY